MSGETCCHNMGVRQNQPEASVLSLTEEALKGFIVLTESPSVVSKTASLKKREKKKRGKKKKSVGHKRHFLCFYILNASPLNIDLSVLRLLFSGFYH